jgi:hypothetical protein
MSKARDLANLMSTGNELADGNISVSEINDLTATAAELNIMDGVTATTAELNIMDGVTSTAAELNILDGVTATASELNIIDGVTATTAELNYSDGVTSNIQTQIDTKQPYATIAVTVVDSGGNKYALDGTVQQLALLTPSVTYRFDQSDSSNSGHPLLLSTTSNGTHGGGSAFTTGVTAVGTPGSAGAYTQVKLEQDAPDTLYYYCSNHSGMGGEIDVRATVSSLSDLSITATASELNIMDGVTATTAELNIMDGVTSTATELNILDGVTSTAAELNKLDGYTGAVADLNRTDITTEGTSEASKVVTADSNGVVTFDNGKIEESTAITSSSNAATINLRDGDNFTHTLSENVTYTFSNPAASGKVSAFTLKVIQDSSARTITWPTSVDWASATAPTLTSTSGGVDVFVFTTYDGGTIYYGFTAGQAMG